MRCGRVLSERHRPELAKPRAHIRAQTAPEPRALVCFLVARVSRVSDSAVLQIARLGHVIAVGGHALYAVFDFNVMVYLQDSTLLTSLTLNHAGNTA